MTTYSAWPPSLPQRPLPGMRSSPQSNKLSFSPERGVTIDRRAGSSVTHKVSLSFDLTSFSMLEDFELWFQETLYDGTLAFRWEDPRDQLPYLWKFTEANPPYEIQFDRGTHITISFSLNRLYRWVG